MPRLTGFPVVPIPGPRPLPVLGHLPRVFQFLQDPVGMVTALRRHGDVAAVAEGSPALVCVFGAERNREILSVPDTFRHDEDFVKGPPGSSIARTRDLLVAINGEKHKRHRRLMMPAFSKGALERYATDIVRVAEGMVDKWPYGGEVDLDVLLRDLALCTAVQTLFGLDVLSGATRLGEAAAEFVVQLTHPLAILAPYDLPGTPFRKALRLGDELIRAMEGLLAEKRALTEPGNDALAMLVRAVDDDGARFTDEELMAEALTLFIAGHETTAKALTWTMFLLERHPDTLADVLDEVNGVLGGRSMTAADIPKMPLLDRVVKESMRVLAPVPILFLRNSQEDQRVGRFTLPKGANVVVSPYATHHDPERYPDPERFEPSRWEGPEPSVYEYMPFGAGPRICVGALFAQQSLRLILPTVLSRARIAVRRNADISRLTRGNILMPRHGVPVRLERAHRRRLRPEPIRGDVREMVSLS